MSHHWNELRGRLDCSPHSGTSRTLDEALKDLTVRVQDAERLPRKSIDVGKFPHGQLDPADRGTFRYTITTNPAAQIIRIDFGGPVTAVGLTVAECEALVGELERAKLELRGITQ